MMVLAAEAAAVMDLDILRAALVGTNAVSFTLDPLGPDGPMFEHTTQLSRRSSLTMELTSRACEMRVVNAKRSSGDNGVVGSMGIRRRKPARHLPKVGRSGGEVSDTPPVMWPAEGSGFEADPYSPAGTAQRFWWLVQRARPPTAAQQRWLTVVLVTGFSIIAIGAIVFAVTHIGQ